MAILILLLYFISYLFVLWLHDYYIINIISHSVILKHKYATQSQTNA